MSSQRFLKGLVISSLLFSAASFGESLTYDIDDLPCQAIDVNGDDELEITHNALIDYNFKEFTYVSAEAYETCETELFDDSDLTVAVGSIHHIQRASASLPGAESYTPGETYYAIITSDSNYELQSQQLTQSCEQNNKFKIIVSAFGTPRGLPRPQHCAYEGEQLEPITTQYNVSRDVYVRAGSTSDINYNTEKLVAKDSYPTWTRLSYLAFDFDNRQLLNENILTLKIKVQLSNAAGRLQIRETANNWSTEDISYNNQPEIYDGTSIFVDIPETTSAEWIYVDMSPFIANGSFTGSIAISNEIFDTYTSLYASESSYAPSLTLTASVKPIPESVVSTQTLAPNKGTYVRGGSSQNSVISSPDIVVKTSGDPTYTRNGLLQFDLSDINLESPFEATLRLNFKRLRNNINLSVKAVNDWNEETVTWSTQPTTTSDVTIEESFSEAQHQQWVDIDVTSLLSADDSLGSFRLSIDSEAYVEIHKSNQAFTPELVITTN
ncbi:CBM96 family carbohydrate-binding protein [Pelagibaculum spongiae]|uniref:Carbohydrate-binding module family 96 domain-containing protein n=1 Tax=Pelagibaculum spongiae TaxID=2080658 RepID=A0A2V1GY05_9GAMM|nr:DNRLRE domain-containing protein [Pelagibaculum spongiae]PVZ70523.1 hypothetical protein DC094_08045 [Pelagibaculum spongiae]